MTNKFGDIEYLTITNSDYSGEKIPFEFLKSICCEEIVKILKDIVMTNGGCSYNHLICYVPTNNLIFVESRSRDVIRKMIKEWEKIGDN